MTEENTKEILDDIFSFNMVEAKKDYESTDFYKSLVKYDRDKFQIAEDLIHKWNGDMLIALHYLEKNKGLKLNFDDLFRMFNNMINIHQVAQNRMKERFSKQ